MTRRSSNLRMPEAAHEHRSSPRAGQVERGAAAKTKTGMRGSEAKVDGDEKKRVRGRVKETNRERVGGRSGERGTARTIGRSRDRHPPPYALTGPMKRPWAT